MSEDHCPSTYKERSLIYFLQSLNPAPFVVTVIGNLYAAALNGANKKLRLILINGSLYFQLFTLIASRYGTVFGDQCLPTSAQSVGPKY